MYVFQLPNDPLIHEQTLKFSGSNRLVFLLLHTRTLTGENVCAVSNFLCFFLVENKTLKHIYGLTYMFISRHFVTHGESKSD